MTRFDSYTQKRRIAVVTQGVKLAHETKGYTRFRVIAELLVSAGYQVDLITSTFQHWEKAQRDCADPRYHELPYRVVFIDEPGYSQNIDLRRVFSHAKFGHALKTYFKHHASEYDLIYCEIPPNNMAHICTQAAQRASIPSICDINDLWPEAMRMVINVPVLSKLLFYPLERHAHLAYRAMTAAVGTSDEYAARPHLDRNDDFRHITVYVGNNLADFDKAVEDHAASIQKPDGAYWVTYAGTLGASYDLASLIQASALIKDTITGLRIRICGDGPDKEKLQDLAARLSAPVDFLGYLPYEQMAAELSHADIVVNSLVPQAPQSIVTKIGDYLASRSALINTGANPEFRAKVKREGFGVNVPGLAPEKLASAIQVLHANPEQAREMAAKGRVIAETQFDQQHSYQRILTLIQELIQENSPEGRL